MTNDEIIGKKLRELRLNIGYTQSKVSKRFGWDRSTLCNYEAGRRTVSADVFMNLLDYYEVKDTTTIMKELMKEMKL